MSAIHKTYEKPAEPSQSRAASCPHAPFAADAPAGPSRALVMLLATGAGLSVAALYYNQPMLGVLAADIGVGERAIGFIPTLTQLGYALGILLLAPLGDRHDRRTIILLKAALLIVALLACGMAPSFALLLAASLAIGLTATLAQDIVPAAATLAHDAQRGRIVGTVMTGLLLGILLSRVVSGVIAAHFGWRSVFVLAAVGIACVAVAAARGLPRFAPTTDMPYRALLGSLLDLVRRHPRLRHAALAQGLLSMGFSAFWSTLAVMLHGAPFHLGSDVAGAFGLAGAAGALAAPLAGHIADRRGPDWVTRVGAGLTALAFAAMCLGPALSPVAQLWLLGVATVVFDLGIQSALIGHQTIVYAIDPAARSRLNAVLLLGMFIGMAAGSAIGSALLASWGWGAVTALATLSAVAAFAVRLRSARPSRG